jgi:hypothetical protein
MASDGGAGSSNQSQPEYDLDGPGSEIHFAGEEFAHGNVADFLSSGKSLGESHAQRDTQASQQVGAATRPAVPQADPFHLNELPPQPAAAQQQHSGFGFPMRLSGYITPTVSANPGLASSLPAGSAPAASNPVQGLVQAHSSGIRQAAAPAGLLLSPIQIQYSSANAFGTAGQPALGAPSSQTSASAHGFVKQYVYAPPPRQGTQNASTPATASSQASTPGQPVVPPLPKGFLPKGYPDKIPAKEKTFRVLDIEFYYCAPPQQPAWGGRPNRVPKFEYHAKGFLVPDYKQYSKADLEEYIFNNPRNLVIWVQNYTGKDTKFRGKLLGDEWICRWKDCPGRSGKMYKPFHRIVFDERPMEAGQKYDPYVNAGYMHLYCAEKCWDFIEIVKKADVRAENRIWPREDKNPFALDYNFPEGIKLFNQWKERQLALTANQDGPRSWEDMMGPRNYSDAEDLPQPKDPHIFLWSVLAEARLADTSPARQKMMNKRRRENEGCLADEARGNLETYLLRKKPLGWHKLSPRPAKGCQADDDDDGDDGSDGSDDEDEYTTRKRQRKKPAMSKGASSAAAPRRCRTATPAVRLAEQDHGQVFYAEAQLLPPPEPTLALPHGGAFRQMPYEPMLMGYAAPPQMLRADGHLMPPHAIPSVSQQQWYQQMIDQQQYAQQRQLHRQQNWQQQVLRPNVQQVQGRQPSARQPQTPQRHGQRTQTPQHNARQVRARQQQRQRDAAKRQARQHAQQQAQGRALPQPDPESETEPQARIIGRVTRSQTQPSTPTSTKRRLAPDEDEEEEDTEDFSDGGSEYTPASTPRPKRARTQVEIEYDEEECEDEDGEDADGEAEDEEETRDHHGDLMAETSQDEYQEAARDLLQGSIRESVMAAAMAHLVPAGAELVSIQLAYRGMVELEDDNQEGREIQHAQAAQDVENIYEDDDEDLNKTEHDAGVANFKLDEEIGLQLPPMDEQEQAGGDFVEDFVNPDN